MDYRTTLHVREDAWYIRLYAWAWSTSPRRADLCRLFWGLTFVWVPLLFWLLAIVTAPLWGPPVLAFGWLSRRRAERRWRESRMKVTIKGDLPEKESRRSRALDWITERMAALSVWCAGWWPKVRPYAKWVWYAVIGVAGLILSGALLYCIYLLVALLVAVPSTIWKMFLAGIAGAVLFTLVVYVFARSWVNEGVVYHTARPVGHGARGVGRGTTGLFRILVQGAKAFKYRTCPKIVVVSKADAARTQEP